MSGCAIIAQPVAAIMAEVCPDRGALPERVRLLRDAMHLQAGQILTWSPADRVYRSADGLWCVLVHSVRRGWGTMFCRAPAEQLLLTEGRRCA